ncbi:MAG: hypothetical protein K2W95_35500 [Candidatus Obscuribacterales bacterium]|nr:hypothetical protein [Candidatus Obscuribacterales bacterium]
MKIRSLGWGFLALVAYLLYTYPFIYVLGGLALAVIATQVTLACVNRWRANQYKKAVSKDALQAAVLFWVHAFRWEKSGYGIDPNKLMGFKWALERGLAQAHADSGLRSYPELGIFYHRPHDFSLCPLMVRAGEGCGIAYGCILECSLAHVHMRISDERIDITGTLGATEWRTIWRKGDKPEATIMAGHRWSGCQCGDPAHADLTTQLTDPRARFLCKKPSEATA